MCHDLTEEQTWQPWPVPFIWPSTSDCRTVTLGWGLERWWRLLGRQWKFFGRSEGCCRVEGPFHNTVPNSSSYFSPRELCGGGSGQGDLSQLAGLGSKIGKNLSFIGAKKQLVWLYLFDFPVTYESVNASWGLIIKAQFSGQCACVCVCVWDRESVHHVATVLLSQIEISEVLSTIDTKPFSTFPTWRERGGRKARHVITGRASAGCTAPTGGLSSWEGPDGCGYSDVWADASNRTR